MNSEYNFFRHDFDYITAESGATEYFPHDKENKKIRIRRCTISIHYEFLDEYIKQKNDDKLREIECRKEMEQQRKEIENQIQKNNNNL